MPIQENTKRAILTASSVTRRVVRVSGDFALTGEGEVDDTLCSGLAPVPTVSVPNTGLAARRVLGEFTRKPCQGDKHSVSKSGAG